MSQNAVTVSPDLYNQSRLSPMGPMGPMGPMSPMSPMSPIVLIYPKTGYHPPGDDP
jgi:hypothetical protein